MTFDSLRPLAERAAIFTALRQDQLLSATDELGEHRWDIDLTAGTLTFAATADPSRTLVARAHLIASIAPGPRSLLWGWAHPQGSPGGPAARLRDYGAQYAMAALSEAEVPFPDEVGDDTADWIAQAAHVVGGVAAEITGLAPYSSAPLDGGTRVVVALEAPLAPLTLSHALVALPRILSALALPDGRTAVWDLARLAGWHLQWTDDAYRGAIVGDGTESATFRFDDQARIVGFTASLR